MIARIGVPPNRVSSRMADNDAFWPGTRESGTPGHSILDRKAQRFARMTRQRLRRQSAAGKRCRGETRTLWQIHDCCPRHKIGATKPTKPLLDSSGRRRHVLARLGWWLWVYLWGHHGRLLFLEAFQLCGRSRNWIARDDANPSDRQMTMRAFGRLPVESPLASRTHRAAINRQCGNQTERAEDDA